MGIYDAMKLCKADISTISMGTCAYMGAFLLAAGTKGKRFCMPNARLVLRKPLSAPSGLPVSACFLLGACNTTIFFPSFFLVFHQMGWMSYVVSSVLFITIHGTVLGALSLSTSTCSVEVLYVS